MKCNRWGLLPLLLTLLGCVPDSKRGVEDQSTSVTLSGTLISNRGTTRIYFGDEATPLAETTNNAGFSVVVPRQAIVDSKDRRLYFYSSTGAAAVSSEITDYEVGVKDLSTITLTSQVSVTGTILAEASPVAGAVIQVGRTTATSAADGTYSLRAPRGAPLPVTVTAPGYVITRALWPLSIAETRTFHLYSTLAPTGSMSIPVSNRTLVKTLPLSIKNNLSAAFIRISSQPFTATAEAETRWIDLSSPVTLSTEILANPVLYYQFADKEKTITGEVQMISTLFVN